MSVFRVILVRIFPAFSRIRTEYGKIQSNSEYGHFLRSPCCKEFFLPHRRSNWIPVLRKYFLNYVYLKEINKNLKEIETIQFVSKSIIFLNLWISKLNRSLKFEIMKAQVQIFVREILVQNILFILSFIASEEFC